MRDPFTLLYVIHVHIMFIVCCLVGLNYFRAAQAIAELWVVRYGGNCGPGRNGRCLDDRPGSKGWRTSTSPPASRTSTVPPASDGDRLPGSARDPAHTYLVDGVSWPGMTRVKEKRLVEGRVWRV